MEQVIKTTVGHALKALFIDNVAFTIAAFLVEMCYNFKEIKVER